MPILYKIFLFFLLKGGAGFLKSDPGFLCEPPFIQLSMPSQTILNLQGDPSALEEAITICEAYRPVEVERNFNVGVPQASKISVDFGVIADEMRTRISHQLILQLTGKILVEWTEGKS